MAPRTCVEAEPYALRVTDDSMLPEFRSGQIVIVDPTGHARDGAYVVASVGDELYLRRLAIDETGPRLEAEASGFPAQPLANGLSDVRGVVVQRAGARRREHKRYD